MGAQTLITIETEILAKASDKVITVMANNQTAKERFDIGGGYNQEDYKKVLILKRLLLSEDTDIQEGAEVIKSKLNQIKNKYL